MGTGAIFRESMKPQISPLRKSLPSPFLSDITAAKIAPVPNFYSAAAGCNPLVPGLTDRRHRSQSTESVTAPKVSDE